MVFTVIILVVTLLIFWSMLKVASTEDAKMIEEHKKLPKEEESKKVY